MWFKSCADFVDFEEVALISWQGINSFSRGRLPKKLKLFLRCNENKKELFLLLASSTIAIIQFSRVLVATCIKDVLCIHDIDWDELTQIVLEEANQGLFLHAKHTSKSCNLLLVKTVHTELVVIAVHTFQQLSKLNELWIESRTGKTREFILINEISTTFGPHVCNGLLFFHAFSNCETQYSYCGKTKSRFLKPYKIVQR